MQARRLPRRGLQRGARGERPALLRRALVARRRPAGAARLEVYGPALSAGQRAGVRERSRLPAQSLGTLVLLPALRAHSRLTNCRTCDH